MWFNPLMSRLLRSPLHPLLSKNTLLVTFTGRKSGRLYTTPVNYTRQGALLTTLSYRQRTWWRNLRGGSPVTLRLAGRDRTAASQVLEAEGEVAAALDAHLRSFPQYARYLKVSLAPDGRPNPEDLRRAAAEMVVIQFQPTAGEES